jgi:hypothetical protein
MHLEEASQELARPRRHVQHPRFADAQGGRTMQEKACEASLFIVHDDHTLGRILLESRALSLLHTSFDRIDIYHT